MASKTPKTKRSDRPKRSNYDPGIFHCVLTVADLAEVLGVPEKSIPLIVPLDENCKSEECPFNAVRAKNGFCPFHCNHGIRKKANEE
jgi:hypothetical protein